MRMEVWFAMRSSVHGCAETGKGVPGSAPRPAACLWARLAPSLHPCHAMKATIYPRVTGAKLRHLVPPAYQDAVAADTRPEGEYSLLLFAHTPRDVVPSPPVRKALRRLETPAPDGILAVGTVFTDEALSLLADAGARPIAFRKAKWTDESARARQL